MIRIMIVDDHSIVRLGLVKIIEKNHDMKIVAEYANGAGALNWIRSHDCDVALIDIAMPGISGIDLLKQIQMEKPHLPVLILSNYPEDQFAVRLIKSGASGYLNKECAPAEIEDAVRSLVGGNAYFSPMVAKMLAKEFSMPDERLPHENLSNREYQVFLQLASAKSVSEIADALALSPKTVSTYRARILYKMRLANNIELMRYAIINHFVENA